MQGRQGLIIINRFPAFNCAKDRQHILIKVSPQPTEVEDLKNKDSSTHLKFSFKYTIFFVSNSLISNSTEILEKIKQLSTDF